VKYIIITLFIFTILFLQIGILPNLKIFNVYPNTILLIIISLGVLRGWKENLIWIIIVGLFLDFYSLYSFIGISVVALLLINLFSRFVSQRFLKYENKLSLILIFLFSCLLYEIFLIIIFKMFDIGYHITSLNLIVKLIYNSILGLPIFYIIKWYVDKVKQVQS